MAKRTPFYKEQAVLRRIVLGHTYVEISQLLTILVSTIKKIRKRNSFQLEQLKQES